MLTNYIKLAWRILGRKKFFTFITLFGISFTLMVLMIFVSYLQAELGDHAPMKNRERMLLIDQLKLQKQYYDTIYVKDTIYENGVMKVDSTFDVNKSGMGINISELSRTLLEKYVPEINGVERYALISNPNAYDLYLSDQKLVVNTTFIGPEYWQIFNHQILEGRYWGQSEMNNSAKVVVLSDQFATKYFGKSKGIINEEIPINESIYKVVGVYKKPKSSNPIINADAYIPYVHLPISSQEDDSYGPFSCMLLAKKGVDLSTLRSNIEHVQSNIPITVSDYHDYDELYLTNATINEAFARNHMYFEDPSEALKYVSAIFATIILLFILLPTLNLINLNVSRIMDRSSEIGVRKAFGANQTNILTQFVFENVVQSILGGVIGMVLALVIIYLLNDSKILGDIYLITNAKFYLISFLVCIFFGVLSGIIPAYKMSKLQIVNALKNKSL